MEHRQPANSAKTVADLCGQEHNRGPRAHCFGLFVRFLPRTSAYLLLKEPKVQLHNLFSGPHPQFFITDVPFLTLFLKESFKLNR